MKQNFESKLSSVENLGVSIGGRFPQRFHKHFSYKSFVQAWTVILTELSMDSQVLYISTSV